MGVDYVQDRSCRVKEELGLETLVGLLKSRAQAARLQRQFEEKGEDPKGATIRRVVIYPSGPVEEKVSLDELMQAGAALKPLEPACDGCTANFRGSPFGCCGYLNYPISDPEERWLMARLPDSLSSAGGIYLNSALRELKIDGAPVARMRKDLFFERPEPVIRQWGSASDPFEVSSNQILQFLLYSGGLTPLHTALACLFVGLIPHDIAASDMQGIVSDPAAMQDYLVIDENALSVLETTQLGMFFMGMMSAAINSETLLIDA